MTDDDSKPTTITRSVDVPGLFPASPWPKWRADLAAIGGPFSENELVAVPAGPVREMIEEGERCHVETLNLRCDVEVLTRELAAARARINELEASRTTPHKGREAMTADSGMWGMVSEALDGEKLPDSINSAIYGLRDGELEVVPAGTAARLRALQEENERLAMNTLVLLKEPLVEVRKILDPDGRDQGMSLVGLVERQVRSAERLVRMGNELSVRIEELEAADAPRPWSTVPREDAVRVLAFNGEAWELLEWDPPRGWWMTLGGSVYRVTTEDRFTLWAPLPEARTD